MSYAANTLAAVCTMLSNCAAFRTEVGAADAAAALAFCIKDEKGFRVDPPYALVTTDAFNENDPAKGTIRRDGEIGVLLHLADKGTDLGAEARSMRVRDLADDVKAQLYAQMGVAGRLASFVIAIEGPTHFDTTGAKAGTSKILLIIKWRA